MLIIEKAFEVIQKVGYLRDESDILDYKPKNSECFSIKLAWECIRVKMPRFHWAK